MPASPPTSSPRSSARTQEPAPRNNRLFIVLAVLAVVSVVVAALVIFSSGEKAAPPEPTAQVTATGDALVLGPPDARVRVVVREDFAGADSRAFDLASRDFLRIGAARGDVQVSYQPVAQAGSTYSRDATGTFGSALSGGTPKQALALHDLLFDRQPEPGQGEAYQGALRDLARKVGVTDLPADAGNAFLEKTAAAAKGDGVTTVPDVRIDGRKVTADSPVALADALQRALLAATG